MLEFTKVGSYALTVNYFSAIFYCYGYWGFVVEKNRRLLISMTEESVLSREREKMALEREHIAQDSLRERTELSSRLAAVSKHAQAGALSASVAHELNQPLAAIQLNIEEAQRIAAENALSGTLVHLLNRIKQDNHRAAMTVSRVRDMFRKAPLQREHQLLDEVVKVVLSWMQATFRRTDIQIELSLNATTPVLLSSGEVEHIVLNLMDNAIDALKSVAPGQGVIRIKTWLEPDWICLSVEDNGPGVPDHLKDNLFELAHTSKANGMGLGLWLARYLVERQGGQLSLIKSHQIGARFELRLPQA
jgi:C4-dicarboxylate-specific signal transduction histidine kinase